MQIKTAFGKIGKLCNEIDVMCRLRQHLVKLGNYAMRLTSVVLRENN